MSRDTIDRNHIMNVYVARYAHELAAFAWQNYQTHGRGVVALLADADRKLYLPIDLFQASLVDVAPNHPMLMDLVRYRPATQFALSFGMSEWSTTIVSIITPRTPPPACVLPAEARQEQAA